MAKHIEVVRSHNQPLEQVRSKLDRLAGEMESHYGLKFSPWAGNTREGKRTGAKGVVRLEADRVVVSVEVSSLIPVPESKIRSRIEQRLDEALA
ncbi:MAG TPA: polyhydroxyalkanoic acid system family protein [Myxococcota bacterium]|nr:polyhydroxyalkanoic acid system family protein [Myxococcota bacterium]HRY94648.1 polyhydroxyalkanoic acid system family protein [Myxococcota bacterium]HSA20594.1 polyhydroxyalkanoic acid system family protein [Myxococcota bacterium]